MFCCAVLAYQLVYTWYPNAYQLETVDIMKRLLWFPLYIDDFLASKKVLHMTIGEQGAYLRLLMLSWSDQDCSLPAAESELKMMALWTIKTDGEWKKVRACFIRHPEKRSRLYNPRLYAEWVKVEDLKTRRRHASEIRWQKTIPSPIPTPPRTMKDREGKGFTKVGAEIQGIADKVFPPI